MPLAMSAFLVVSLTTAPPPPAASAGATVATLVVSAPAPKGRPIAFTRVGAAMRPDQTVGRLRGGIGCLESEEIPWRKAMGGFGNIKDVFLEELKAGGFRSNVEPGRLFADTENTGTDLEIGAMVQSVDLDYCQGALNNSAKVSVDVEWQLYSNLRKEVLATITTHGAAEARTLATAARRSPEQDAFAVAVRALLADPRFRQVVLSAEPAAPVGTVSAAAQAPIQLVNTARGPTAISDAVGSVVAVFAGDGFGSGVLVSADGLLLTNHHVVGDMTTVRIRWSDGFETTGEVLRSDKRRDVALVRTAPRGRQPLLLNRDTVSPGAVAFAIGTPLDPKLQNTVTRGIVSANRIVDGFSFIQGDVPVTHGNSGGPLLDEKGEVIGLTDWGVPTEKGSTLNFFIPIGDALDFLALKAPG